jgi:uncharacterized damage-inducible protein DinB
MTNYDFYLGMLTAEEAPTVRVLDALPEHALDYKPHERSRTAGEIAWVIAGEMHMLAAVLTHGTFAPAGPMPSGGKPEAVGTYKAGVEAVKAAMAGMTEEKWNSEGVLDFGGGMVWKDKMHGFAWGMLNDGIHHRGQLSVYLRPMGGKVPSIYGPSADSTGGQE